MLLQDWQIITKDVLLTLSHLRVALCSSSYKWRLDVLQPVMMNSLHLPSCSLSLRTHTLSTELWAKERLCSRLVTSSQSNFVTLFRCSLWKSPGVCILGFSVVCHPAVLWSLRRFILPLTSLLCGRELPTLAILKASGCFKAQYSGNVKSTKATWNPLVTHQKAKLLNDCLWDLSVLLLHQQNPYEHSLIYTHARTHTHIIIDAVESFRFPLFCCSN